MLDRNHEGSADTATRTTPTNAQNPYVELQLVSTDEPETTMSGFPWVDFVSGCLLFPVFMLSVEATRINSTAISPVVEWAIGLPCGLIGILFLTGFSPWCKIPGLKHTWSRSLMTGAWTGIVVASLIWLLVPANAPANNLEYVGTDISLLTCLISR